MKILVNEIPLTCSNCLFCGRVMGRVMSKTEIISAFTGCKLLEIEIPFEIGITTRLGNCPLRELN